MIGNLAAQNGQISPINFELLEKITSQQPTSNSQTTIKTEKRLLSRLRRPKGAFQKSPYVRGVVHLVGLDRFPHETYNAPSASALTQPVIPASVLIRR